MTLSSPTKTSGLVLPISSRSEHWATEHFLKSQRPIQSPGTRPRSYFKRSVCALCNENPRAASASAQVRPPNPSDQSEGGSSHNQTPALTVLHRTYRRSGLITGSRCVTWKTVGVCSLSVRTLGWVSRGRKGKKIAWPLRPAASSGSRPLTLHLQIKRLISLSSVRQANCHTCKSVHSDHCPNVLSLVSAFSFAHRNSADPNSWGL